MSIFELYELGFICLVKTWKGFEMVVLSRSKVNALLRDFNLLDLHFGDHRHHILDQRQVATVSSSLHVSRLSIV